MHPRAARLRALGALAAIALGACSRSATEPTPPEAVATVDGAPIFAYQLQRELRRFHAPDATAKSRVEVASALLENLILEKLLLAEADREQIAVAAEETAEEIERVARGYRPRDFQEMLHRNYLTPGLLGERVSERMRIERLLSSHAAASQPASDDELRAYYEANRGRFSVPEQVHARQIVVRTREEAEQLRERAAKTAFEELARNYSIAPEASQGGDLGFFGRGVMPPIFDQICFALEPGTMSDVVPSEYGYHLFKLVEKRAAEQRSFDEAREDVALELAKERRRQAVQRYLAELQQRAKIVRQVDALARLVGAENAEATP
ncbi:MAG: peptidyl-prolyl cis-trans isomerase [Deltaproteobacteria bacterium]|nr:peptidyl-prolyl cis-trans isomerase [Deltaproteobacteria bacterium]